MGAGSTTTGQPDAVVPRDQSSSSGRFSVSMQQVLQACIQECLACSTCPEAVRELCAQHRDSDQVPWRAVVQVYQACRTLPGREHLRLHDLCSSGGLRFASPAPRQRSAALQQRLQRLQDALDDQRYAAMVQDVAGPTSSSGGPQATQEDMFPTTRLQLSFGLHVLVTMGAFFALAFYGARWAFGSDRWAAAAGAVGLTAGMLLETTLLILRSNMPPSLDRRYAHLLRPDFLEHARRQQQQQQQQQKLHRRQQQAGTAGPGQQAAGRGQHAKQQSTAMQQQQQQRPWLKKTQ